AAVAVIVEPKDAKPVVRIGIDVQLVRNLGESAVFIVVVEPVPSALQPARAAGDGESAILAETSLAEFRQMIKVKIDVVGDVQIEVAVIIVVTKGGAGAPAPGIGDSGFSGHVGEGAVAVVV